MRQARRPQDLILGRVRASIGDVLRDRRAKQQRILQHKADLAPQGIEFELAHVMDPKEVMAELTGRSGGSSRGKGDGVYVNTAGVGVIEYTGLIAPASVRPGDVVLLSGDIGRHGMPPK